MSAARYDIVITRSSYFSDSFSVTDDGVPRELDLYTAAFSLRRNPRAVPEHTFDATIDAGADVITVYASASETEDLDRDLYLWDLALIPTSDPDDTQVLVWGLIFVRG